MPKRVIINIESKSNKTKVGNKKMTNKEIMKKIELNQRTLNLWTSELENFHGFVETRIFLETAIPKKEKEIKRLKSYLQ